MKTNRTIILNFTSKFAIALIALISVSLVSKYLGAEGRGILSLFTFSIAFIQLFTDFGSSSALINLSYTHNQRNLWRSSYLWIILICLIAQLVVSIFYNYNFLIFTPLLALVISFSNVNLLLLLGNTKINTRNILLFITPIFTLLAVLYYQNTLKVSTYIIFYAIGAFCTLIISYFTIHKYIKQPISFRFNKSILSTGFWTQSGHAIQFLNYRLNFILIAWLLNTSSLGIYSNAILISESIWMIGHSIGQVQHLQILNNTNNEFAISTTKRYLYINLLLTILAVSCLVLIPTSFWEWLFSKEFIEIKSLFKFLSFGILAFAVSNILNHYFHAKNKFKIIVIANSIGLLANLISALILIPTYKIEGASMAWSCGLLIAMLVYIYFFAQQTKESNIEEHQYTN